jgi:TolB protein
MAGMLPNRDFLLVEDASDFSWAPDGEKYVYTKFDGNRDQLYIGQVGNDDPVQLGSIDLPINYLVWSPDSSKLAVTGVDMSVMESTLFLIDPDTHHSQIRASGLHNLDQPRWSHDGKYMVVTGKSYNAGGIGLYIIDMNGGGIKPFAVDVDLQSGGYWFPQQNSLVFIGSDQIYRANVDGSGLQQLTNTDKGISNRSPNISPDGKKIAYVSSVSGNDEIWVMDAQGGNQRQLTRNANIEIEIGWSNNSKEIWFSHGAGIDSTAICSVDVASGLTIPLVSDHFHIFDFRPKGR